MWERPQLAIGPVAQPRRGQRRPHARGTLATNLIGGYLVDVCVGMFEQLPDLDPIWRLALVTGFLGALTTFSSFSAKVVAMLQQGRYAFAAGTACAHLFGSLALTALGLKTVGLLWER